MTQQGRTYSTRRRAVVEAVADKLEQINETDTF